MVISFAAIVLVFAVSLPAARAWGYRARARSPTVAHQLCSCVYVAGRNLDACRADLIPAVEAVHSESVEPGGRHGVRARVPIYAQRVAFFECESGCILH